ncbi:MAG TPA: type II toxin-antitoxin system VapC family toxin [Burkholderiaceae bacterium]|nr:type II toxin-antitoxin system VapC family toxin [Burkholderiaceae bacterium]
MRLLLDTHILLWILQGASELPREARRLIEAAAEVHVSSVSLWEASIKVRLGKLKVDMERLESVLRQSTFLPLHVTWAHATALRQLPLLHRDPFDRMLVAQAVSEPMHLITHDAALARYSPLVTVV